MQSTRTRSGRMPTQNKCFSIRQNSKGPAFRNSLKAITMITTWLRCRSAKDLSPSTKSQRTMSRRLPWPTALLSAGRISRALIRLDTNQIVVRLSHTQLSNKGVRIRVSKSKVLMERIQIRSSRTWHSFPAAILACTTLLKSIILEQARIKWWTLANLVQEPVKPTNTVPMPWGLPPRHHLVDITYTRNSPQISAKACSTKVPSQLKSSP